MKPSHETIQIQVADMKSVFSAIFLTLILAACASSPFDTAGGEPAALGPGEALAQRDATGVRVVWGGRIVGIVNRDDATEVEILALPLGPGDRPRREADGGARFVMLHRGFLDPMTYSPGRYVTALGRFTNIESRPVGAFSLDHPVLVAEQIELWPVNPNSSRANLNLGIGVRF